MGEAVIVGAGLAGLSTAARLAKLGHRVTVCERTDSPGGLLRRVRGAAFEWDATPMATTVPAVLRDLFRKSGRPIERYVDLQLSTPARRHVFPDGSTLDLPTGSRGAQLDAVTTALGTRAALAWTRFVDQQAAVWDLLRARVLDVPGGASALADRRTAKALGAGQSLDRLVRKTFGDERLRLMAGYPAARTGRDPAAEPAFRAVETYVERTFGVWRAPGGAADLSRALLARMAERGVEVRLGADVVSVSASGDTATGIVLRDGRTVWADVVVTAVAPRHVWSTLLTGTATNTSATAALLVPPSGSRPATVTHLGLGPGAPDLPREVALHGDPLLVLSGGNHRHGEPSAWTVVSHGVVGRDVLDLLAERGIDLRDRVVERVERVEGGRSAYPLDWEGARTAADRAALAHPLANLHCLGTGLVLGASVPYVAWQAAHVADLVGKA